MTLFLADVALHLVQPEQRVAHIWLEVAGSSSIGPDVLILSTVPGMSPSPGADQCTVAPVDS